MRLPSKLLGCMRVGVGVGAVMLGGCDLVDEAKARVLGEEDAVAEQTVAEQTVAEQTAETPPAPEPMLLGRSGVATVVEDAVVRSKSSSSSTGSSTPPPIADLGRPSAEPEGSQAFIPYDDGRGPLAVAPLAPLTPERASKPKPRPRKPKVARSVDEPCDPGLTPTLTTVASPEPEWQCPACGRG